jgi:hypothetical protein
MRPVLRGQVFLRELVAAVHRDGLRSCVPAEPAAPGAINGMRPNWAICALGRSKSAMFERTNSRLGCWVPSDNQADRGDLELREQLRTCAAAAPLRWSSLVRWAECFAGIASRGCSGPESFRCCPDDGTSPCLREERGEIPCLGQSPVAGLAAELASCPHGIDGRPGVRPNIPVTSAVGRREAFSDGGVLKRGGTDPIAPQSAKAACRGPGTGR